MMSYLWLALVVISITCGAACGTLEATSAAALEGAAAAVELSIGLAGTLCLWNGVLEVMKRCGLDRAIARAARPLLGRLMPGIREDDEALGAVSANLSANLLGLGNAATPLGIRAAKLMVECERRLGRDGGRASNALCTFVVMNTASLQLVPATIAAIRAEVGAAAPFDILPAVWCASAAALAAGLLADAALRRFGGRRAARRVRMSERSAAVRGVGRIGAITVGGTHGGGAARHSDAERRGDGR